jgi:anti-anti-sigma regulatory factor
MVCDTMAVASPSGVLQQCGGRYGQFLTGWCGGGGGGRVAADASAQITELDADDHACLTFGEREELFDLTAAFVRDGLAAGLKVMCLSDTGPGPVVAELTRRGVAAGPAMDAGRLVADGCDSVLLAGQVFRADTAVGWLEGELASSREQGFAGLRVAVDMSWALRPVTGVEELPRFEEGIAAVLAGSAASVLCQYDRDRFDPVTLASVAGFHTRSVAAATYYADALLRICRQYAPAGIRAAGELDYQAEEPLALALAEAVRIDGDVVINLSGLAFIDARCTLLVADAARAIASSGRAVILECVPEVTRGFARLGIAGVPGVRLVDAGEH